MSKKILGLDLGTNSIDWAWFEGDEKNAPVKLIDLGVRIFQRAVKAGIPTPKNHARRNARLARRKQKMLHYLISLGLLPHELEGHPQPETIFSVKKNTNNLGCPYALRAKALDEELKPYELGRVFLHLTQRRGFQSSRKTLLGDMADDPDAIDILGDEAGTSDDKEETAYKKDISALREEIKQ
ncbi:MAG: hypothetical protein GY820_32660 [Gammaproteobacteria bacterium]|nr:hypothetical protein [Gammaproteobacteria bacterium]